MDIGWLKFLGSTYFSHFPIDLLLRSLKCTEISLRDQTGGAETPHKILEKIIMFYISSLPIFPNQVSCS